MVLNRKDQRAPIKGWDSKDQVRVKIKDVHDVLVQLLSGKKNLKDLG
ncbi:MAG: hypothetical protein JSV09_03620 [Thermoplasmata archaeon]|nr:MAG: hypothetical protein JSV09_03620 [Thermoplasmata archaeon]